MSEITPDEVKAVLDTETALSIKEITDELHEGEGHCSECGKSYQEYKDTRKEVNSALRTLMDRGQITSTPKWNYRLARRSATGTKTE